MAKKNSAKYWEKRLDEIAQKAMDDTSEKTMRELRKLYNDAMKAVRKEISKLYDELLIDGELSTTALYQYGRWQQLQQTLATALQRLGQEETAVVTKALEKAYIDAIGKTSTELAAPVAFALVSEKAAAEAVKRQKIGGQHFSSRIWANKDKLLQLLNKEITDVIMLGRSKDKAVKAVTDRFGVAFSDADRLVRTEVMHTINSAQKAAYTNSGYTRYKYLANIDKRTSDICRELNGKCFNFEDARVGVNYPPMHPRCRSTVVPDLKSRKKTADLTDDEMQALNKYISSDSYKINNKLRAGAMLDDDDKAFVQSLDSALDKLPEYAGTVYRSVSDYGIDDVDAFIKLHKPGEPVLYPTYTSCSEEVYDAGFPIQYVIQSKHGKDIRAYNDSEKEILYKRDTIFYVTAVIGNTIYMEEGE